MYKAIFYDLDNTLYDQKYDILQRIKYCCEKYSLSNEIELYWFNEWLDNGPLKTNIIDKIINKFQLSIDKKQLIQDYRTHKTSLTLDKNVKIMLENLKQDGVIQIIITNGNPEIQEAKIKALALHEIVDEYVCATGEYAKPSTYWYTYFINKYLLNINECVSVGDWFALEGVAAEKINMDFIYIQEGIQEKINKNLKKVANILEFRKVLYE